MKYLLRWIRRKIKERRWRKALRIINKARLNAIRKRHPDSAWAAWAAATWIARMAAEAAEAVRAACRFKGE